MNLSGHFPENIGNFLKIRNVDITKPPRIGLMNNNDDNTEDVTKDDFEIEEMQTKNTSFSIDQLGKQCGKLQYIRELTQNSIEAIQGAEGTGEIFWTFDREEKKYEGVYKLSIIDTGPSMTGEDLRSLMNNMYSSGKVQSIDGNFGIGAKVAALYRNPRGMLYKCFRNGKGVLAEFARKNNGTYGMKMQDDGEGGWESYKEIPYYVKPKQIENNGTVVTLVGRTEDEDTFTSPPEGEHGVHWLSRYLNGRYFKIPEGIDIRSSNRDNPNFDGSAKFNRRKILGMKHYLDKYQNKSGIVEVPGARMHWWVLKEAFKKQNYFTNLSHTGSLMDDEVYDLRIGNKSNRSRLNRCGIIHLANKMVIYAEPTTEGIFADPSRSELLVSQGEKCPWLDWADDFLKNMPDDLKKLEEEASDKASDVDIDIQAYDILKKLLRDFEIPKYAVNDKGDLDLSSPVDSGGTSETGETNENDNQGRDETSKPSGTRGNRYSDFTQDDGEKGRKAPPSAIIPKVEWVTPATHPHIDDRAASFIRSANRLLINKEFRGFKHYIEDVFVDKGGGKPGAKSIVERYCKLDWHVHLCETVLRVQMLKKGGKTWKQNSIDSALSEEALTASVVGIHHLIRTTKSRVGYAIGRAVKKTEEEIFTP